MARCVGGAGQVKYEVRGGLLCRVTFIYIIRPLGAERKYLSVDLSVPIPKVSK